MPSAGDQSCSDGHILITPPHFRILNVNSAKITISGGAILKMKKHSRSLGNFVNQFHTWAESFNNNQCLECWVEPVVFFLSWVEPWTIATNKFELDLRCYVANLVFNACHALFGA